MLPPPILTYSLSTDPPTVRITTDRAKPAHASLTFEVSCPQDTTAIVRQIVIFLSADGATGGPDPANLAATPPPANAASIVSTDGMSWKVSMLDAQTYVFTPTDGPVSVGSQALTIAIRNIEVSGLIGTGTVTVQEWAANDTGTPPAATADPSGQQLFNIGKFPSAFFFTHLRGPTKVRTGERATLTWSGSDDATYRVAAGDAQPVVVQTPGTWTSPELMEDTTFTVIATVMSGTTGQSAEHSHRVLVPVTRPEMVRFWCTPSNVDYNTPTTLHWEITNADGVWIETNKDRKDYPATPKTLPMILQYGSTYSAYAWARGNSGIGETISAEYPLWFKFNPLVINDFSADLTEVDIDHRTVTLSVDVEHARSVFVTGGDLSFQQDGPAVKLTLQSTPTDDATYTLLATWVDGTVTSRSLRVPVRHPSFYPQTVTMVKSADGKNIVVTITLSATNAYGITGEVQALFCNGPTFTNSPARVASRPMMVTFSNASGPDPYLWVGTLTITLSDMMYGPAMDPSLWLESPNYGVSLNLTASGIQEGKLSQFRVVNGSFTLW